LCFTAGILRARAVRAAPQLLTELNFLWLFYLRVVTKSAATNNLREKAATCFVTHKDINGQRGRSKLQLNVSRGGLEVSVSSYVTTGPGSILGDAIFPRSKVADSKRSESRSGYSSAIKMPAVKSTLNFTFYFIGKNRATFSPELARLAVAGCCASKVTS